MVHAHKLTYEKENMRKISLLCVYCKTMKIKTIITAENIPNNLNKRVHTLLTFLKFPALENPLFSERKGKVEYLSYTLFPFPMRCRFLETLAQRPTKTKLNSRYFRFDKYVQNVDWKIFPCIVWSFVNTLHTNRLCLLWHFLQICVCHRHCLIGPIAIVALYLQIRKMICY